MISFMQDLLFGLAYVMPIGIQNMYVINSAMQRSVKIIYLMTIFVIILINTLRVLILLGFCCIIK